MHDEMYMARALKLAQRFTTIPIRMSAVVIVKDGEIVGEGFHYRAGERKCMRCAWLAKSPGATPM